MELKNKIIMSLLLGFHEEYQHTHPVPKKNLKYTLEYPATQPTDAMYPERGVSGGYRYISMEGFNTETTLTLSLHVFSTAKGVNLTGSSYFQYSLEIIKNNGGFKYYDLKTLDINNLKVPKSGAKYNHFLINRKFVLSEVTGITDFSEYKLFSVYITQYSGISSGDTSSLEIIIENIK